jgi:hypothetical protein
VAASIIPDLLDLMPDTFSAQPGTVDATGKFTAVGSPTVISCRIEDRQQKLKDPAGKELVSTVQVFTGGVNSLNVQGFRYTLPARYDPRVDLLAISVESVQDENGPHHEVIMFP